MSTLFTQQQARTKEQTRTPAAQVYVLFLTSPGPQRLAYNAVNECPPTQRSHFFRNSSRHASPSTRSLAPHCETMYTEHYRGTHARPTFMVLGTGDGALSPTFQSSSGQATWLRRKLAFGCSGPWPKRLVVAHLSIDCRWMRSESRYLFATNANETVGGLARSSTSLDLA